MAYAALLDDGDLCRRCLTLDGEALRSTFDAFNDRRGQQVLSVFATVLAQVEIDEKTNEVPTA